MPRRRPAAPDPLSPPVLDAAGRRLRVAEALRPYALGTAPGVSEWGMTERRIARTADLAAGAVLPALGTPLRSRFRARGLIRPLLLCGWAEFDALFEATVTGLLALPPARADVEEPAWDDTLGPAARTDRPWRERAHWWAPPATNVETVAPGGTVGRVARRGTSSVLVTADGRPVRPGARCACPSLARRERPAIPFEEIHLDRASAVLDVVAGAACGACRAALP